MLKMSSIHTNTRRETFASIIVINDALLEIMPDIDQSLLQFIDVMNLVDLLLHFSLYVAFSRVHFCAVV